MEKPIRGPFIPYGRTSKDDKRRLTIENQQQMLAHWQACDPDGGNLLDEAWDVGISGKIPFSERPGGKKILAVLRQQQGTPVALVVPYIDRFARDTLSGLLVAKELNSLNCRIVSISEGLDARKDADPFQFNLRLVLAEQEWYRIRDRMQRGKARAIERDGAPPGGNVQFGYRLLANGQWEIDPTQAAVVRRAFEMILEGQSQYQISEWIRALPGLPRGRCFQKRDGSAAHYSTTEGSDGWNQSRVSKMLSSRVYIGERKWGGQTFPCPPIIDLDTWERVQAIRARRAERTGFKARAGSPALLSGLLSCAACGGHLYAVAKRDSATLDGGKRPREVGRVVERVYRCDNTAGHPATCRARQFQCKALDGLIWPLLRRFLLNPGELLASVLRADQEQAEQGAALADESATWQQQLDALDEETAQVWALQQANGLPIASVAPGLKAIQEKRAHCLQALEGIALRQRSAAVERQEIEEVAAALADLKACLPAADNDPELRARLASKLVRGGVVETNGKGKGGSIKVRLELRWGEAIDGIGVAPDHVVTVAGKGPNRGADIPATSSRKEGAPSVLTITFDL